MTAFEIIALCIICLLLGHIVGYRTRKQEESPKQVTLIVEDENITAVATNLKEVRYNGIRTEFTIMGINNSNPNKGKDEIK